MILNFPDLITAAIIDEKIRYKKIKKEANFVKARKDALVVGNTTGDPLKDTSGQAIIIYVKLSAITS